MENTTDLNREGWLNSFALAITPLIEQRTGLKVPLERMRFSCSFPRGRATPNRKGVFTTGQCWHGDTHASGLHEIMINPLRDQIINEQGEGVGETMIHEIIHAALPKGTGHKAPFARAAKAMGLEGKPTATIAGSELIGRIKEIAEQIGDYPHKALAGEWGRKQTTRLLKVMCVDCGHMNEQGNGYTARITMTWIENAGLPTCPCGNTMSLIEKGDEADLIALKPIESSATYRLPLKNGGFDPRFQIRRTSSEHFGDRWAVLDFGPTTVEHEAADDRGIVNLNGGTARIVAAESKNNALDMIDAIREGLYTWDDLEDEVHGDAWDEGDDDGKNPLADEDPDLDALLFIEDDEDETPDHPEDQDAGEWTHPITGKVIRFDYDEVAASREG